MSLEKNPSTGKVLELFGPTVEFLTSSQDTQSDFCVLKGTLPPGISVPLHSHTDTEDFFVISGEIEGLRQDNKGYEWIRAKTNDYIHMPSDSRHAWRNVSNKPTLVHIITTKKLGHFFEETGRPKTNTPQAYNIRRPCTFRRNQHKIWILERLTQRECISWDTNEFLNSQLISQIRSR
ncbi:MAG: dimethylsulfonioproprionate lyase family protein [Nitrososphaeraceae archaeon]